jgi:Family of unknown function (DUF6512)
MSADNRSGTRLDWWGALFILVVGTLWHFVYQWSGDNPLLGWVAPVNESVWEHVKLVAIPSLIWNGLAASRLPHRNRLAWAAFLEACTGPAVIVTGYYVYSSLLGRGWFVMDIALFVAAVAAGRLVNHRVRQGSRRVPGTLPALVLIAALLAAFAAVTVWPPELPVFQEPPPDFYHPGAAGRSGLE